MIALNVQPEQPDDDNEVTTEAYMTHVYERIKALDKTLATAPESLIAPQDDSEHLLGEAAVLGG